MALPVEDKERHLLPRWHSSRRAAARDEVRALVRPSPRAVDDSAVLADKAEAWEQHRTVSYASDLVSSALLAESIPEAVAAARFLLTADGSRATARTLARRFLGTDEDLGIPPSPDPHLRAVHRARIRDLRRRLVDGPRNPLAWADLAYEYTILALPEKASAAMAMALRMAPESRLILRSAVRLYVNAHNPERAIGIIRGAAVTPHDPWLIAAEISASSAGDRTPKFAKVGRSTLQADHHAPFHLSELAGAMATLEYSAGGTRTARRLFQRSLVDPTENAVAQAEWAARRLKLLTLDPQLLAAPGTFEATARDRVRRGRFEDGMKEALLWLDDERFSREAAALASYVAAVGLRDYGASADAAETGLVSNPDDWLLTNNLVFALASAGRVDEAAAAFARLHAAPLEGDAKATCSATDGLLRFRKGDVEGGRLAYQGAAEHFARKREFHLLAVASIFWAREELLVGQRPAAAQMLEIARRAAVKTEAIEVGRWIDDLAHSIDKQLPPP